MESGFVAGTLVHTDKGLVPIEQIKIGDMVLSRHESGDGELAFKRVIKELVTTNQPIRAMRLGGPFGLSEEEDDGYIKEEFLFTTVNQLFWTFERKSRYEINVLTGKWIPASNMEVGEALFSFNGKFVDIVENLPLHQTNEPDKAFYKVNPDSGTGIFLDVSAYRQNTLTVPDYISNDELDVENVDENGSLILESVLMEGMNGYEFWMPYEPEYFAPVHHLELEDFHTYFVGEIGVRVHSNANTPEHSNSSTN